MTGALDFTAMHVMHAALRRELVHLDRITTSVHVDARDTLAIAAGWQLFKLALRIHRTAGDGTLWPFLREALVRRPNDLALLAAVEAERDALDALIEAIDAAAADPHADPAWLGVLVDALVRGLSGHLDHEEVAVVPLARRVLGVQMWQAIAQAGAQRLGPDAPRLLPWLLDGADAGTTERVLARLPESVRHAYATKWLPAYVALDRWRASPGP